MSSQRDAEGVIVVGWDGTDSGRDALRLAAELHEQLGGLLVVASVLGSALPGMAGSRGERADQAAELERLARERLGDVEISFREALEGPAAQGLREVAEEEGATLVVIGSPHRGTLGRTLLGSTAEKLLELAPCPLAVAPRDYAASEHVGLGIVGVGYDESPQSRAALGLAARIARRAGDELEVLTVAPGYTSGELPLGPLEPLRHEAEQRLEHALREVPDDVARSGKILVGDPAALLEEEGVELDLLIIGSRAEGRVGRLLHQSVSADVIARSPCPVIVVPRGAEPA